MSQVLRPSLTMIGFKGYGGCFVFISNYTSHHSLFLLVQVVRHESRYSLICVGGMMAAAHRGLGILAVSQAQDQQFPVDHFISFFLAVCEVGMIPKGPSPEL